MVETMLGVRESDLVAFILEAKKATWAGNGRFDHVPFGGKRYEFKEGDFQYQDTFYGGTRFMGNEIVGVKSWPVWGMNYSGWLNLGEFGPMKTEVKKGLERDISEVIKIAIRKSMYPFIYRGPDRMDIQIEGKEFSYNCFMDDCSSIERFSGSENVFLNSGFEKQVNHGVVSFFKFHGGLLQAKLLDQGFLQANALF